MEAVTKASRPHSVQTKKEALRLYFVEGYGYRKITMRLNLRDPSVPRVWVYNYLKYGESWFRSARERTLQLAELEQLSVEQMQHEIVKLQSENILLKQLQYSDAQNYKSNQMKQREFEFIHAMKNEHNIKSLCAAAKVSRSGYYRWRARSEQILPREIENQQILVKAKQIYEESCGIYGYRRIGFALRNEGIFVNHKRLQRILYENDLQSRIRQQYVYKHPFRTSAYCPNLLKQDFTASAPNQKWVTDITYFPIGNKKLACACILDLYRGEVIALKTSLHATASLATDCLEIAVAYRNPNGTIFHSDQGIQFSSYAVRYFLQKHSMVQSMSRRGNCYDNARMESFFGHMKAELPLLFPYHTIDGLEESIYKYINYYNYERIALRFGGKPIVAQE